MKQLISFCISIIFASVLCAQQGYKTDIYPHKDSGNSLTKQDSIVSFDTKTEDLVFKPSKRKTYHWYDGKGIYANQGGYAGRLLEGAYEVKHINGQLLFQGKFVNGLQNGQWRFWDVTTGKLVTIEEWNRGKLIKQIYYYYGEKDTIERRPMKDKHPIRIHLPKFLKKNKVTEAE